jgi:hypothetical protein
MSDKIKEISELEDGKVRRGIIRNLNGLEHYEGASLWELSALNGEDYGENCGEGNVVPKNGYGVFL